MEQGHPKGRAAASLDVVIGLDRCAASLIALYLV